MSLRSFKEGDLVEVISWGFKGKIIKKRQDQRSHAIYDVQDESTGEMVVCRRQEMILRARLQLVDE